MIKFEKVSKHEFKKNVVDDEEKYELYSLPTRNSTGSVGYDFKSPLSLTIKPGERVIIPTGVKAKFPEDIMLMIVIRSSLAFKYNINLINQVGIIDSDYYGSLNNEGHIYIGLENNGDKDFIINEGDKIAQGIFVPCHFVNDEKPLNERDGWSYMKKKKEE